MKYSVLIAVSLFLLGCAAPMPSAQSKFYRLQSPAVTEVSFDLANTLTVVVGPIDFAEYLKRSSLVVQVSETEYDVLKLDQWGGSLESEFQLALGKNLIHNLPHIQFVRYPSRGVNVDFTLRAEILGFDGKLGQQARLEANWWIEGAKGRPLKSGRYAQSRPVSASTLDALVQAESVLISDFSRSLSEALQQYLPGSSQSDTK
ncbi:MAG: membrane integrity-associated transporter subunit PqiC [Hahellaceae bacterium]|nr:membrane integrity-associated transporter subunit PqiC [Hahellaceae bacterium]